MFTPYEPCEDCVAKNCGRCSYEFAKVNYQRALEKIVELTNELGRPITILK